MERGRHDSDGEKSQIPGVLHVLPDRVRRRPAPGQPPLGVEMPRDIYERNKPGVALQRIEPILDPRILRHVRFAAKPDVDSVAAVKQERQKDGAPLDKGTKWNGLQLAGDFVVLVRAHQDRAIGPKMLSKKRPYRKNAGQ